MGKIGNIEEVFQDEMALANFDGDPIEEEVIEKKPAAEKKPEIEEVVPKPAAEKKPPPKPDSTLQTLLTGLMKDGTIPEFEDDNGEPLDLSKVDIQRFQEIIATTVEHAKETANEGKVSTTDLPDDINDIIKLVKEGGNPKDILRKYAEAKEELQGDPYTQYDGQNPAHHDEFIKFDMKRKKASARKIEATLRGMTPEEKKEEADELHEHYHQAYLTAKQKIEDDTKAKVESQKKDKQEYLANVEKEAATSGYKGEQKKSIIKSLTQANKNGVFPISTELAKQYNDPKLAIELAEFVFYKDDYLKRKFQEREQEIGLETTRKRLRVKPKSSTSDAGTKPPAKKADPVISKPDSKASLFEEELELAGFKQ